MATLPRHIHKPQTPRPAAAQTEPVHPRKVLRELDTQRRTRTLGTARDGGDRDLHAHLAGAYVHHTAAAGQGEPARSGLLGRHRGLRDSDYQAGGHRQSHQPRNTTHTRSSGTTSSSGEATTIGGAPTDTMDGSRHSTLQTSR